MGDATNAVAASLSSPLHGVASLSCLLPVVIVLGPCRPLRHADQVPGRVDELSVCEGARRDW